MRLAFFHGREDPEQDMNDWGFAGPTVEGIAWTHTTYDTRLVIGFFTKEACDRAQKITGWEYCDDKALEAFYHGDVLKAGEHYYGDWEFVESEGYDLIKQFLALDDHQDDLIIPHKLREKAQQYLDHYEGKSDVSDVQENLI